MNRYSPVFLDLAGKDVLVVGGGPIAQRKIATALQAGARVTVVAPEATARIGRWAADKRVRWMRRRFSDADLKGRELVYCSTDDEALNARVGNACRGKRIWVNVVDRPALCSFIVPAIVRRGDVVFAISTGGASPALAKFLMKRVRSAFGREVGTLARLLKKERARLLRLPMQQRKRLLGRALNEGLLKQIRSGRTGALKRQLDRISNPRNV